MLNPKQGDILLYIGKNFNETGIVLDTSLDGAARVMNGSHRETVAPHSFQGVVPGTDATREIAKSQ